MKKYLALAVTITSMLVIVNTTYSQKITPKASIVGHGVINFKQLADKELANPPKDREPRVMEIEEIEEAEEEISHDLPVPKDAKVTAINGEFTTTLEDVSPSIQPSPRPNSVFRGLTDNLTAIPPDVMGAAGPKHLFETLNTQYRVFSKSGDKINTLSPEGFWSGLQLVGTPFGDPHLVYDANTNRWFTCTLSKLFNGDFGIFIGASETSDPTGNWYQYALDVGPGTFTDYPLLGYNKKWIVITANTFVLDTSAGSYFYAGAGIAVINKVQLMTNKLKSLSAFLDPELYTISPAETMDANEEKEYLLSDYNGNFEGNGYLKMGTITGPCDKPVYSSGTFIGVNRPWGYDFPTDVNVPQKGSKELIDANDPKMRSVIVRNGFVWATHTVYLPAENPNRASSDWWQINPTTQTVAQYGRLDDASCRYHYSFSSMAVTANNDVLIGASAFSKNIYASAVYAYRASSDPANSIRKPIIYRHGLAPYYKTYGGTRNRWGDYSATCIDPSDGSFWTLQEFAYYPTPEWDRWSTVWANVSTVQPTIASKKSANSNSVVVSSDINLTATPNPSKGHFLLSYLAQTAGKATITVYSLNGKIVYNQEISTERGMNQLTIHLQNIASGSYIVTVQNAGEAKKEKLIVVQ